MTNTSWAAQLKQITDRSLSGQRPFVCDGYPTESHVMIIGTNPATPLNMDWWDCWIPDYGFDYNLFMSRYRRKRRKPSPTRQNLKRITDCLRELGLKSIETNVYRREARLEDDLWEYEPTNRYPNDDVLHLLLKGLQPPKAVIAHGDMATEWLATQRDRLLPDIHILDRRLQHLWKATDGDITYICEWVKSLLHAKARR